MKKKIIALVLALGMCFALGGCLGPSGSSSGDNSSNNSSQDNLSCTVTFKQNGQSDVIKTVDIGEDLTDIPTPKAKVGYSVVWDVIDFTDITENIVVTAIETANTYTITYDAGEGTVTPATQDVVYDSTPTLATPTLEGYTFTGWTYNGNAVLGKWTIAGNVTLVASWVKDVVNTYTVTFKQDGQTDKTYTNVEEGSTFTEIPETENKVGYTVEWDEEDLAALTNISGNVIVEAVETANTYTITYDAGDGTVNPATQEVVYDSTPTLAIPTLDGYTFTGWTYNGNAVLGKWTIAENVTLVSGWTKNLEKFTITFRQNGQTDKVYTDIVEGSTFTDIPKTADKEGYTVEWEETDLSALTNISSNVIVEAVETANIYTITYDAGDGVVTPATQDVEYDSTPTLATPTLDGYTFTGWTYNGNAVSGKWTIADNVTLVAGWVKDVVPTYTVTFRQSGQTDKVYENVEKGSTFTNIPEVIAKVGYTIVWDEEDLAALTNVSGNVIVEAIETVKTYTITLNANGGTVSSKTITIIYGEAYTLETPAHDDYKFAYWTYNGEEVSMSGVWNIDVDGNAIELVAKWGKSNWTSNF